VRANTAIYSNSELRNCSTEAGFYCVMQIHIARPCCRKMAGWLAVCLSHASIVSKQLNLS